MAGYRGEIHRFMTEFISETDIDALVALLKFCSLKPGDILFESGEEADGVYLLVTGRLAVQKGTGFGERTQVVAILDAVAPVGEGGLVAGYRHGATVTAIDSAELLFLSSQAFQKLCMTNPKCGLDMYRWILGRVTTRLNFCTQRLAHIL